MKLNTQIINLPHNFEAIAITNHVYEETYERNNNDD